KTTACSRGSCGATGMFRAFRCITALAVLAKAGGMASWTLDDIPWHRFDRSQVDPELVPIVKAASLVEHNGAAYAHHLCRIFADAYYAANEYERPYERRRYRGAYAGHAYRLYRPHHVERGVAMLLKAIGLTPNGWLGRTASRLAWHAMRYRARRLEKMAGRGVE